MTECDEIIIVTDFVSTKKTSTIRPSVRSAPSINCHVKKARYCCILYIVLLVVILLLISKLVKDNFILFDITMFY